MKIIKKNSSLDVRKEATFLAWPSLFLPERGTLQDGVVPLCYGRVWLSDEKAKKKNKCPIWLPKNRVEIRRVVHDYKYIFVRELAHQLRTYTNIYMLRTHIKSARCSILCPKIFQKKSRNYFFFTCRKTQYHPRIALFYTQFSQKCLEKFGLVDLTKCRKEWNLFSMKRCRKPAHSRYLRFCVNPVTRFSTLYSAFFF